MIIVSDPSIGARYPTLAIMSLPPCWNAGNCNGANCFQHNKKSNLQLKKFLPSVRTLPEVVDEETVTDYPIFNDHEAVSYTHLTLPTICSV